MIQEAEEEKVDPKPEAPIETSYDFDKGELEPNDVKPMEELAKEAIEKMDQIKEEEENPQPTSFPTVARPYEEVKSMSIEDIITESISKDELDIFKESDAPKENLFPVKPISKEEEEAAALTSNTENVINGIIGSSLVDTLKERQMAEDLKLRVLAKFDNQLVPDVDIDTTIRRLVNEITELIKDDIQSMSETTEGLEVNVSKTVDNRNNECFNVVVKNFTSPVFDCTIYPAAAEEVTEKTENEGGEKAMEKAIFNFLSAKVDEIEHDYSSEEEAKTSIATALYGAFKDEFKDKFTPARMMEICKEYVDNYVTFNNDEENTEEEVHTAADEL